METLSPVLSAWVQPAAAPRTYLVDWELRAGYEDAEVYVMRSFNGMAGTWQALNEVPLAANGALLDEPPADAAFADFHYRLVITREGRDYVSPSFLPYDVIPARDYSTLRQLLSIQMQRWMLGEGMRMWHYVPAPAHAGVINAALDPESRQQAGAVCAYGEVTHVTAPYGYAPPILTLVKLGSATNEQDSRDPEGLGSIRSKGARFFTTPFPKPGAHHVLVHPHSGEKWAVGETSKAYRYLGLAVVRYEITAEALLPHDERQKLVPPPIPRDHR